MGADATPAVLVSVRVVDEQGMPLPHVLARSEEIDGLEAGLRTDGEGRLAHSWTGAPVGRSARLVLSAPGREARELREEILADGLDFGVVTLRPGTSVAGRVVGCKVIAGCGFSLFSTTLRHARCRCGWMAPSSTPIHRSRR